MKSFYISTQTTSLQLLNGTLSTGFICLSSLVLGGSSHICIKMAHGLRLMYASSVSLGPWLVQAIGDLWLDTDSLLMIST